MGPRKVIFWLGQVAYACLHLANQSSDGVFIPMQRFSFLGRICLVAWNDNMEVVSNCCYVSLAANSPCIPGLKAQNSFLFVKKQDIVERDRWYVVFQGGLEIFSFSLIP